MKTDGAIRVGTKLDTKNVKEGIKELENDLKKGGEKVKRYGKNVTTAFTDKTGIDKIANDCENLTSKLEEAGEAAKSAFTGMSTKQLETALRKANQELEKTEAEIADVDSKISEAQAYTEDNFKHAVTDEQTVALLEMEEQETGPLLAQREELTQKAAEYKRQLELITSEIEKQKQGQDEYQSELKQTTRQTKKMGDAGEKAGKKTEKGLKKAANSSRHMNTNLKRGIKKLGKMALACMAVEGAFTAVRRAANTYLEDNEKLKQQISSIWFVAGQVFGPFIESFVQGLSTVIVWVNSLVKALTGVDLIAKANAAALRKQAAATKETANEAKKASRQLAGFDEMNKLTEDSSKSSGNTNDPAAIFDTSMAGDIPNFLEKIKQQILDDDWYGAGETLAQTLMDGIRNFDWTGAGNTLGNILTGILDFSLGFLLNYDASTVLNGFIDFITGFFDTVSIWLQEKDWGDIGYKIITGIWDGLVNTDWGKYAKYASELIGSLLGALASAVVGSVKGIGKIASNIWNGIKDYFDDYVDWGDSPGDIIEGLWEGIKDAFKNAGTWIYNNIWVPFRDGFKEAFGIHSPSTKMKEFGRYLIEGLKNGIGNIWEKVSTKFTEWKTKLTTWFTDRKENFKTWGTDTITKFKSGLGDIWSKVSSKFTDAKTKITDWANSLKSKGENAGSKFTSGLQNGFNTIKDKMKKPINALINMLETAINWIIGKLNKISFDVPDWVPGIGGKTFGFNISKVSIPRLARGGIVNNPGRGVPIIAGEAGKEAVLPLQNHTEWMDILADKINSGVQKIVVPIYLNGTKIAEKIIEISNQRNFATNGVI